LSYNLAGKIKIGCTAGIGLTDLQPSSLCRMTSKEEADQTFCKLWPLSFAYSVLTKHMIFPVL